MENIKYSFFGVFVTGVWFSLIFLLVYGNGVGWHYRIAPVFVLLSLMMLFYNNIIRQTENTDIIKILIGLVVLSFISSYHYFSNLSHRTSYLCYLCYSISGYMVAITSYSIVKTERRMSNILFYLTIAFFIIGIFRFYRASSQLEYLHANTAYYYILMPLPLLLINNKSRLFHIVVLFISTILCVLSVKRGAMIAIAAIWCVYLFYTLKNNKKSFLYVLLLLFVGFFFISEKVEIANLAESTARMEERFATIEEDGGSGRVGIIETFFRHDFKDLMGIPDIFIGKGFEGTYYKYRNLSSMHNDFLEITYSLGVVGFLLLCCFYYCLYRKLSFLIKMKSTLLVSYMSMFILFIFFSFIGCNFNYFYLSAPLFLSLGVIEGMSVQSNS